MMNALRWTGASMIFVVAIALLIIIPVLSPQGSAIAIIGFVLTLFGGPFLGVFAIMRAHREMIVDRARYLWYEGNDELSVGQEIKALKKQKSKIKSSIQSDADSPWRLRGLYGDLQDVEAKLSMLRGTKKQKLTQS